MSEIKAVNLKQLEFSPDVNPLMESKELPLKKRKVRSGTAASVVHSIEEKDDEHFVKVFAAGVTASYELSRTSSRVFQAILQEYEKTPMTGGFVDTVYLAWFNDGLSGRDIGMSEKTFQRGLKDLIQKGFLAPRSPSQFWVNPSLFFKGNRVMFVKEYRRKRAEVQEELEFDKAQL